jgi:hypothetical protein
MRRRLVSLGILALLLTWRSHDADALPPAGPEIFPLSQVRPGMKGVVYTIYSGDTIEKVDLTVLGVLPNTIGPGISVILVRLEGPHAQESGVVAGMSGSPVYLDGKLAGALALKLGIFTKEAIGGVMPIEQMLPVLNQPPQPQTDTVGDGIGLMGTGPISLSADAQHEMTRMGLNAGASLVPIGLPLVTSGVRPEALAQFSTDLAAMGLAGTTAGGTAPPQTSDADIEPGDMVGIALVRGDLALSAGCTATAVIDGAVFLCGHPLFGSGHVALPMQRGHVLTTLSSALESTKIITVGGPIGSVIEDRATAVMGRLGAAPATIPVSLKIGAPALEHSYHFEISQNQKLTPVLLGIVIYNSLISSAAYNDGMMLRLEGTIDLDGHPPVLLHNVFAPTSLPIPDGFLLTSNVQSEFTEIFDNPYEKPRVKAIDMRITPVADRRTVAIENAWSEKTTDVRPGETVAIKVLLRPYRGNAFVKEIPIIIPERATPGKLRVVVSDAAALEEMRHITDGPGQATLAGLNELIQTINRERANDRVFVSLMQPASTLVVGGKEMPDLPPSAMQVLKQGHNGEHTAVVGESSMGEWSVAMDQVVTGQQTLTISIR